MSRAAVVVDIDAVRLVCEHIALGAHLHEELGSGYARGAVGTVQTDLDTLEGIYAQRDQVAHVTVAACHIVHRAADVLAMGKGQLRPVLIKHMKLAVDVVLHQQQSLFGHFLAVAVDQLDTVIVVGVVAGRNHDAAIEIVHAGNVSHRRRSSDVQQVGVCAGSGQASDKTIFKHIGAAAGVLADNDTGRLAVAVALAEHIIIPAKEATNLIGMIRC